MGIAERKIRERENRRRLILQTAERLFFRDGFHAVTVEQIAREAELAKGSIYLHFRSKEELYAELLLGEIDTFYNRIVFLKSEKTSVAERLGKFTGIYLDLFLGKRELFRVMMNYQLYPDRLVLSQGVMQRLRKSMKKNIGLIDEMFAQGIAGGEFVKVYAPPVLRKAFWGMLNGVIGHYLYSVPPAKGDDLIRATVEAGLLVFINGIRLPKGDPEKNHEVLSRTDISEGGCHE
ncbi:MAG: TetR/AcrR family transcriptional regulator [Syntrophaceae bacterium]|nr:TetR/AcrR family transcriptional regulator [Syntrophaceae bacterium]